MEEKKKTRDEYIILLVKENHKKGVEIASLKKDVKKLKEMEKKLQKLASDMSKLQNQASKAEKELKNLRDKNSDMTHRLGSVELRKR
jgi:hypothetical protein